MLIVIIVQSFKEYNKNYEKGVKMIHWQVSNTKFNSPIKKQRYAEWIKRHGSAIDSEREMGWK